MKPIKIAPIPRGHILEQLEPNPFPSAATEFYVVLLRDVQLSGAFPASTTIIPWTRVRGPYNSHSVALGVQTQLMRTRPRSSGYQSYVLAKETRLLGIAT